MMPIVYWIGDGFGRDVNVGGPDGRTPIPTAMLRWIRTSGSPSLLVNGGDVYPSGKSADFAAFFKQTDNDVALMCETPGNHDWKDDVEVPEKGRIPHGYETFWSNRSTSKQPIDATKRGGARYEHFIDIAGWRLLFLDTGDYKDNPWPAGDQQRVVWLKNNLKPGRANMILAHHSRLSRGNHGDNDNLDGLWHALFDASGAPLASLTLSGHDHNVSVYGPRSRDNPRSPSVPFANGIHVVVNGAGGKGHYSGTGPLADGTKPDRFFNDEHYFVTRINLIDGSSADVDMLNFGTHAQAAPVPEPEAMLKIRL